jgi:hypothetical protein
MIAPVPHRKTIQQQRNKVLRCFERPGFAVAWRDASDGQEKTREAFSAPGGISYLFGFWRAGKTLV